MAEQKETSRTLFSLAERGIERKVFLWGWHLLLGAAIILLIVCWQTPLWLIGSAGDFARMMEKIEIVLFVLLLTSPLTRTLRQRLFPRTSAPRM
ncbi:hypothetical protein [Dictyobacter aurantiacus]|uniref:Uncharacterized protein n=1 Tax=Dictyobacter aurantiacus TaxID=1936993 RepID=A0A401ZNK9_9CHLR|nr:hypothetical protein [Dictyobacter aurantiacus]GCE08346.1 hypothetical protein KDAU_56750 [Dictyobacter aurantiacus]